MRLRRLDLVRYGKFTDRSLDFGERPAGQPDLHVVFGPNEAGKSTAFAAFLDLVFGIGAQTPFDFLHPYSAMRIGGALEFEDGTREFARIKRAQNSLLDAEDRPVPEGAIRGDLGGIDRDAYRTMFSLDDETLEKGGESILASRGDLGQLLFSASAGLAHLSRRLVDLRSEADGFYRYRARSGALADLKERLRELKEERETFDTLASDHARLVETRDRSRASYDEALAERTAHQGRIDEIGRHLAALPRVAALRDLRERLAPLAEVPDAPPGSAEELRDLQREEIEIGVQAAAAAGEIARYEDEAAGIVVDEAAFRLAGRAERMAELRARHVTAEKDLPERRLQLRDLDRAIAAILRRIEREGEPEPRRLVLTTVTVGRLRKLIESRSGLEAALQNASTELAEARRRLGGEAQVPQEQGPQGRDRAMAELAAVLGTLREADHQPRQRLAERAISEASETLADRLSALRPWAGTAEELAAMAGPGPGVVQGWKAARHEAETVLARHRGEIEGLMTRIRHLEAEAAGLASVTGIATDREAAGIRRRREEAWAAHRRALDLASADAFEEAMRHDDVVGAGRLSGMADLAKLHQNGQALAVARADLARAAELEQAAAAALARLDAEVAQAIRAMAPGLDPIPSLPWLEDWLARRDRALEAREAVRRAERDLRAAQSDAGAARDRLRAALDRIGRCEPEAGFEAWLAEAQTVLDREAELRHLRAEGEARRRDLAGRESAAAAAEAAERAWTEAWEAACRGCWLGEAAELPPIGTVGEILAATGELAGAIDKRDGLVDRIGKMEKDQGVFREEVATLADAVGVPFDPARILDAAQLVGDRIREAEAARDSRKRVLGQLEEARERRLRLAERSEIHAQGRQKICAFFGVASLEQVARKLADAARRAELCGQAEEAEREIVEAARAPDLAAAEAMLAAVDRAVLEAELIERKARRDDQDRRCHELFAAWSAARDKVEAIGGDAVAAAIEERRRTVLLEIEDGAMRYLQLRAGIAATERALAAYRERHRSSMMTRASAAFRAITCGAYDGLAAQPGKEGETLIALPAGGGSKAAAELSKGTRFQLYLALRVAGYHEFLKARRAVPFVADDIMETFDDHRAEESFRLLGEMAEGGQVIYLTHHRHLCEIARRVCPAARLHSLDEAPASP